MKKESLSARSRRHTSVNAIGHCCFILYYMTEDVCRMEVSVFEQDEKNQIMSSNVWLRMVSKRLKAFSRR